MIIYKITNKINNMSYIGQTKRSLSRRWIEHKRCLSPGFNNPHKNSVLSRALKKYGKDAFTVEVLGTYESNEALDAAEVAFIASLNTLSPSGYNLTTGGKIHSMSQETRSRMSRSKIGLPSNNKNAGGWNKGTVGVQRGPVKAITCLDTGVSYRSIKAASEILSINYSKISDVCRGQRKTVGGLKFKFVELV